MEINKWLEVGRLVRRLSVELQGKLMRPELIEVLSCFIWTSPPATPPVKRRSGVKSRDNRATRAW